MLKNCKFYSKFTKKENVENLHSLCFYVLLFILIYKIGLVPHDPAVTVQDLCISFIIGRKKPHIDHIYDHKLRGPGKNGIPVEKLILACAKKHVRISGDQGVPEIRYDDRRRLRLSCRLRRLHSIDRIAGIRNPDGNVSLSQVSRADPLMVAVVKMPAVQSQIKKLRQKILSRHIGVFHAVDIDLPGFVQSVDDLAKCF